MPQRAGSVGKHNIILTKQAKKNSPSLTCVAAAKLPFPFSLAVEARMSSFSNFAFGAAERNDPVKGRKINRFKTLLSPNSIFLSSCFIDGNLCVSSSSIFEAS